MSVGAPGRAAGRAAAADTAAVSGRAAEAPTGEPGGVPVRVVVTLLVRVTRMVSELLIVPILLVVLVMLAMRVFAWVGREDPTGPAAVTVNRSTMPQASATHADQVRTRMVLHFPSKELSAERSGPAPNARDQREGKRN